VTRDAASAAPIDPDRLLYDVYRPEMISAAFSLAEGPLWDPCAKHVLFTDVSAAVIDRLNDDGSITPYREDSHYANGLVFDDDGSLLAAEMNGGEGGRITRTDRAGNVTVLIDHDNDGKPLNTTDDLALRSDGTIYFTDPTFPHGKYVGFAFGNQPIYRLTPGSERELVLEGEALSPNGLDLSPDETTLYVISEFAGQVLRFDVGDDGALSNQSVFISGLSSPDSMCIDAAGNLYLGTSGGVSVVSPEGKLVGLLAMKTRQGVTNCGFGGDDGKTLYVTAWDSLWQVRNMPVEGLDWKRSQRIQCPK